MRKGCPNCKILDLDDNPIKVCTRRCVKALTPIAVLISDIHYSLNTLALADASMRKAIAKANKLNVPLIVAGDLHDTKANMRAECVNAMIATFNLCEETTLIMVGNHDKINEKSDHNEHSLHFLRQQKNLVINQSASFRHIMNGLYLIPYHSDVDELRAYLRTIPKGSTLIMHQGLQSSNMGDYVQDKSAITKEDVAGFRVISGHYHTRQIIDLPDNGKWDYIGNPYSLSFGEANDPPKGFQVLMNDGSLEFVPTNLRKHVVIEYDLETGNSMWSSGPVYSGSGRYDEVWIKVRGTKEQLAKFDKAEWTELHGLKRYRLDLIPEDTNTTPPQKSLVKGELLDSLINSLSNTSETRKERLKKTWKDL